MWQADEAQRARIKALTEAFKAEVPTLWNVAENIRRDTLSAQGQPSQWLVERLARRFGGDFLGLAMPEFLVFPDEIELPKHYPEGPSEWRIAEVACSVATDWVAGYGGSYAIGLVAGRLRWLLANMEHDPEIRDPRANRETYARDSLTPYISGCARLLSRMRDRPEALDPLEDLLLGRWDGPLVLPGAAGQPPRHTTRYEYCSHWFEWALREADEFGPGDLPGGRERTCLERLYAAGRLDYERFVQVFQRLPRIMPRLRFQYSQEQIDRTGPIGRTLMGFIERLAWESAQAWTPANIAILHEFRHAGLPQGGRWLLKACEHAEALGVAVIAEKRYGSDPDLVVLQDLVGLQTLAEGETTETLAEQLKRFSERTLLAVLPLAGAGEAAVVRALGWEDVTPFLTWICKVGGYGHDSIRTGFRGAEHFSNNDNPTNGVVDRQKLLDLLNQAGAERTQKLVAVLRATKRRSDHAPWGNSLTLLEAVAGWNQATLEASLKKHVQIAIKAYGLLPLERDVEEAFERYLQLRKIAKECGIYGAERQANTRAAVQVGLTNLAQTAGYPDLARLEWAMEARITGEGAPLDQREAIGDWEVELTLDGLEPSLTIFKQSKPLKSVPAGLRKAARFLDFKETQAQIKAQIPRFRASLESLMALGEPLTPDALRDMARLPVMARLLRSLIIRTEDGRYGFLDPERLCARGLDGSELALDGEFLLAHPYHFFRDGLLPDWQREVVRRRIVQPFKQVFRELYILTPAEEATRVHSNRFAGHALKAKVAGTLLQTRGWRIVSNSDYAEVFKFFRPVGLMAEFVFPDAGHYLAEMDTVTSDQIRFFTIGYPRRTIPLAEVPPLIFSEVMRDADLAVSVAQLHDQDSHWSTESYARRAELVTALVADLGLKGVRCEGHFAHVTGQRASYRVHLGSAAIHIEPGNYLCIVPDRSEGKQADGLFLPFADADPKASEVISKILLLVNDDKIKDKSILAQIEAARR
jgi:hypothetical protein